MHQFPHFILGRWGQRRDALPVRPNSRNAIQTGPHHRATPTSDLATMPANGPTTEARIARTDGGVSRPVAPRFISHRANPNVTQAANLPVALKPRPWVSRPRFGQASIRPFPNATVVPRLSSSISRPARWPESRCNPRIPRARSAPREPRRPAHREIQPLPTSLAIATEVPNPTHTSWQQTTPGLAEVASSSFGGVWNYFAAPNSRRQTPSSHRIITVGPTANCPFGRLVYTRNDSVRPSALPPIGERRTPVRSRPHQFRGSA